MLKELRPAIVFILTLTIITGLIYPLAITGIAGVVFPEQAQGSLIEKNGKVIGSALIGQQFSDATYFHGRPSATTGPDPKDPAKTVPSPYNAANSMGSNLGPASKTLADRLKEDIETLRKENASTAIPVDLVTTSERARPGYLAGSRLVSGAARREGARPAGSAGQGIDRE